MWSLRCESRRRGAFGAAASRGRAQGDAASGMGCSMDRGIRRPNPLLTASQRHIRTSHRHITTRVSGRIDAVLSPPSTRTREVDLLAMHRVGPRECSATAQPRRPPRASAMGRGAAREEDRCARSAESAGRGRARDHGATPARCWQSGRTPPFDMESPWRQHRVGGLGGAYGGGEEGRGVLGWEGLGRPGSALWGGLRGGGGLTG